MSHLILPRRKIWTQQPRRDTEIDWSNPITRGLVTSSLPSAQRDVVSNNKFTYSNAKVEIGVAGVGFSQTSSVSQSLGVPNPPHDLTEMTVVCVFSCNRRAGYASWIRSGNESFGFFSGLNNYSIEWKIHSSAWNTKTTIFSGSLPTSVDSGVHTIVAKWSASQNDGYGRLWFDGVELPNFSVTPQTVISNHKSQDGTNVAVGSDENSGTKIFLWGKSSRALSDAEIKSISNNPWQIFKPRRRNLFVPSASSALNASANGAAQAGGSANLAAQVALAAVGIAAASGSAGITVAVPLSAVGFAVSSGTANAVATVTISAAGFAQAAGSAGLSAAVLLQGAGAAQAAGNAALAAQLNALASGAAQASGTANLSGGAPGALSASDGAVASGTAVLSVTVGLTASGSGVASGMASLSGGAAGQVAAVGGAQSGGSAVLRATVSLTAAGFVQAMGAGYLTLSLPFPGFAPLKMAAAHQRLNHLSISARRLSQLRSEVSHG